MDKPKNPARLRRLTPPQREEVIRRYLEGETCAELASDFGITATGIWQLLRRRNIPRRRSPSLPMHSEAEHAEISEEYLKGKSAARIARERDFDIGVVRNVLRRQGVEPRTGSERNRKYNCDHHFFDVIDSEAKAYWLGFISADGYISRPKKTTSAQLVVSLAPQDRQHLTTLLHFLQSTHPIREYDYSSRSGKGKNKPYVSFSIRSEQLTMALANFGIVPAKTFTIRWPTLPNTLTRHYLRGLFDGDGTWNIVPNPHNPTHVPNISFRLTANQHFLKGCQEYMEQICGLNHTKLSTRKDSAIQTLIYGGRVQVSRIFHLMYDDATIWLPRKRERVEPYVC